MAWAPRSGLRILDQTCLPLDERYVELHAIHEVAEAIRRLRVRGAPLIGVAAAMGLAGEAVRRDAAGLRGEALLDAIESAADVLGATRPTAVNLHWALDRMRAAARVAGGDPEALVAEAQAIWDEDRAMCARIGEAGLALLRDGALVHTHCNAGALATSGIGTALAPVYVARARGWAVSVLADETRPLLQGARLTAFELARAGVPCTVLADGMAAARLRQGDVHCVIVGADRIAANGDVANKIGTYGLALAARAHGVPFYVAAPRSTFDPATPDGAAIPIEQRAPDEVTACGGTRVVPDGVPAWNPAFDVTPAALVSAYITDRGVLARDALAQWSPEAGVPTT